MLKTSLSRLVREEIKKPNPIRDIMKMAERQNIVNLGLDPEDFVSFGGGWVNHFAPESYRSQYVEICSDRNSFHRSGGYSTTIGELECRRQICNFEKQLFDVKLTDENVIVGLGSTQLTYDLFPTIADPEDYVVLLDPTYPNYAAQIRFALRNSKILSLKVLDEVTWSYIPNLEETVGSFQKLYATYEPKVILIVSPDNPTGQIVPQEFIEAIMDTIRGRNSFLVIDFAYKLQHFDKNPPKYFSWSPMDYPQLVSVHSNSKWGRGLGRRLGWIEADKLIIDGLERTQQCSILCPDTLHQMAFAQYIKSSIENRTLEKYVADCRRRYEKAAEITVEAIRDQLELQYLRPQGGLYTVVDVKQDSNLFVSEVLRDTGVLFVPGDGFGPSMRKGIRISYGPFVDDPERIVDALSRVGRYIKKTL